MENYEFRKLRGIMTYLVIFSIVGTTTILRFYDKLDSGVTMLIFGLIMGAMLAILSDTQKEWLLEK